MAGTMQRKTIFGGEYKFYSHGMEQDMSGAGAKVGPGPANLNIRNVKTNYK
jgi:hypothetical protein|tara:strand:+ start:1936 stop:2088 length:153 start_codon:yes stop_codon:yes gene_type:complete